MAATPDRHLVVLAYLPLLVLIAHLPALHLPPTVVYMSKSPHSA